jgi:hypothetical protein
MIQIKSFRQGVGFSSAIFRNLVADSNERFAVIQSKSQQLAMQRSSQIVGGNCWDGGLREMRHSTRKK